MYQLTRDDETDWPLRESFDLYSGNENQNEIRMRVLLENLGFQDVAPPLLTKRSAKGIES
jgi:hypothetical protein